MRTTIDIPDILLERVKCVLQQRKTTFRSVVISALEKILEEEHQPFRLRDASVGAPKENPVSNDDINRHIDDLRNPLFNG